MRTITINLGMVLGSAVMLLAARGPAAAQHSGDMVIGSTAPGGGALAIEYELGGVVPVGFVTEIAGVSLYAATDPGFDALETDESDFFVLADGTEVTVEITDIEPGKTAMVLNGTPLTAVGQSVVLGTQGAAPPGDLHHHPELQLILMLPPGKFGEGRISFKLTTTSGAYTESESYTLHLSNGHLAPIDYDPAAYDKDSVKCQATVAKEVRKLMTAKHKELSKCLDRIQVVEAQEAAGLDPSKAEGTAETACGDRLVEKVERAQAKAVDKILAKCGPAGSQDLAPETAAAHVDFVACRVEELVSASYPGAQGLLAGLTALGEPTDSHFPCLVPSAPHGHEDEE